MTIYIKISLNDASASARHSFLEYAETDEALVVRHLAPLCGLPLRQLRLYSDFGFHCFFRLLLVSRCEGVLAPSCEQTWNIYYNWGRTFDALLLLRYISVVVVSIFARRSEDGLSVAMILLVARQYPIVPVSNRRHLQVLFATTRQHRHLHRCLHRSIFRVGSPFGRNSFPMATTAQAQLSSI